MNPMSAPNNRKNTPMAGLAFLLALAATLPAQAAEQPDRATEANAEIHALVSLKVIQVDPDTSAGQKTLTTWDNLPQPPTTETENTEPPRDANDTLAHLRTCDSAALFGTQFRKGEAVPDGLKALATPQVVSLIGAPASIVVGRAIPYLQRRDDNALEVASSNDLTEGVTINVTIREVSAPHSLDSTEYVGEFDVRVNALAGREAIDGVPFDAGKPIIRTQAITTTLRTSAGQDVVMRLPPSADDASVVFVVIQTTFQSADK